MSYLQDLACRLRCGAARLFEDQRRRHAGYILAAQNQDGGFAGREGPSDLYYTGFALCGLALLGNLDVTVAARTADFLTRQIGSELASIESLSLLSSAVLLELHCGIDVFAASGQDRRAMLDESARRHRRDDGGYATTEGGVRSSTYHTFLTVACQQLLGVSVQDTGRIAELIGSRRRADGGLVEASLAQQSGTNPTSAAVALLRMLDTLDEPMRHGAAAFLATMQNAEGGLRANARIPAADLLSTFTGLVTLVDLGATDGVDLAAIAGYVAALEQPNGGFRGGIWDDAADVEYTFYGLGTLSLLAIEP